MFCEKCGNPVNEGEKFCSKCGAPVSSTNAETDNKEGSSQSVENLKNEAAKAAEAVNKAAVATVEGAKKAASMGKETLEKLDEKAGGRFSKIFSAKNLIPLIIVASVVVVLVVCVVNAARLNNFVHKAFSSPEKYYQYVEKKAAQDLVNCGGDIYDSYVLDSMNVYDKSASAELSVELDKDGEELLELAGLAGLDLSWLKSVQVSADVSVKDHVMNMGATAGINKDSIITGNVILDTENENVYFQIPELTKTYIGVELEEIGNSRFEGLEEIQDMNKELLRACPDQKQVEKLFNKYIKLALGHVDDVSKSTKTLKAEGIQQKATELKITMDGDTYRDMMEDVLETMQDDTEIEKMIEKICDASDDLDADDVYDEFQDKLDDMLDDMKYYEDREGKLFTMKVYVDGKGEIIGRKLEVERYGRNVVDVSMVMPKKGSKFGFELAATIDGQTLKIEGKGKESGNKINGEFSFKYNGTSIMDCTTRKLDISELKKGRLNGTLELNLSSGISTALGYRYSEYASMLKDLQIAINANTSKNSAKYVLSINFDDKKIGTVTLAAKTGSGSKAKIPGSSSTVFVEDSDDLEDWMETIDWNKVVKNLDKTDLPSEIVDIVEEVGEELEDGNMSGVMRMLYGYGY